MKDTIPTSRIDALELIQMLSTDPIHGLSETEVVERQKRHGSNAFTEGKKTGLIVRIGRQFASPLVFILLIAAAITFFLEKHIDTIVIAIALIINVVVGTLQEERASRAFDALSKSQERYAVAIRGGKRLKILASELVPGDIILLEGGYQVPADARILEEKDLRINEAVLTGEWLAVEKDIETPKENAPLAEQHNMVFMGTLIESGYGRAVVTGIGDKTEVGKIAQSLNSIDETETPLQTNIKAIARFLTIVIVVAVVAIFALGLLRGQSPLDIFLLSVAIAVATVPSGLPAAVTVVLAIGMETILKRGGLVRNLLAAETLGATTIILTDKTGTLTEAKMHLATVYTASSLSLATETADRRISNDDDRAVLTAAVLASDAFIDETVGDPEKVEIVVHGRPIEKAVILAGLEEGVAQAELVPQNSRLDYLQFESVRRFGASLNESHGAGRRIYVTGAPETLLAHAKTILVNGQVVPKTDALEANFTAMFLEKSKSGLRLIGTSFKETEWSTIPENANDPRRSDITDGTTFAGVMVFEDPVRKDVPAAIKEVQKAGVRVVMMTGDNPETARAIAKEAGIISENDDALVIKGDDTAAISDDELCALMSRVKVVARATPEHKLRIARLLKSRGEVVAMTGDGINDAPALQAASIGIAVESGTEVAKQASDMVLINNSFAIIVAAIEEGRRIVDNLKKILAYLLSGSFSEIFVISGALIAGAPLPFLPTQILWTKIVEEGLMSFSFAFEGKDPKAMERSPREMETKQILTFDLRMLIVAVSVITGGLLVALYFFLLNSGLAIEKVRTIMFAALSMDAIFFTFSLKNLRLPLWKINPFDNRFLLVALGASLIALITALFTPFLRTLLSLEALTVIEVVLLLGIGCFNLATIEVAKFILFGRKKI